MLVFTNENRKGETLLWLKKLPGSTSRNINPYNHTPRRYVVLWIPFSLHTNRSKNYLLLITRHWKSELLTLLKKRYFKRGYSICGNWRATALQVVHLWSRPSTPTDQIITRADYSYKGALHHVAALMRVGAIQMVFNPFPWWHLEPSPTEWLR